jgi:cob(I)alamin adenosyltransferase
MVNLTRIYTKTGDDGTTSLGDMSRTSKNDPRLEAYATVDEANSTIGVVLSTDGLTEDMRALLVRIQNDLFDVGADLCTPVVDSPAFEPLRVLESQVTYLEEQIDKYNADLESLRSFVFAIWNTSCCTSSRCAHSCSPCRALHLGCDPCIWWGS